MRNVKAQTAMEYLLLVGVVAVVVIMAFAKGGFMSRVHDTSNQVYEGAAKAIMGDDPKPIDGGWCDYSPCSGAGSYHFRSCECPAPAFGGKECDGEGFQQCQ